MLFHSGSGKTFSMFGTEIPDAHSLPSTRQEAKGIVPRACEEIFAAIEQRRRVNGIDSEVSVSYVEVFGDEVSDLLKRGARCGHSKVAAQQFVLSGAAERTIWTMQDVEEVLRIGQCQFVHLSLQCLYSNCFSLVFLLFLLLQASSKSVARPRT